jgi:23S rRNA (adenine2503-C2)-methyltransferase
MPGSRKYKDELDWRKSLKKLLSFETGELKDLFKAGGCPPYTAGQIFKWVYSKFELSFGGMTDISKNTREYLKKEFIIADLVRKDSITDRKSETVKFLYETSDGDFIESVLIFADDSLSGESASRITLCISSQAGCPLACSFCATGKGGFRRNLDTSEIVSQVLLAENYLLDSSMPADDSKAGRKISNIVFMGMGEPLLNYENVMKSIIILNSASGYNLGSRHFTISTSGIIPQIKMLQNENLQIRLAVSIHSASQDKRASLMPVSKKYPLPLLMKALKEYQAATRRRITFEYVLIENINDSASDADALKELLSDLDCNLNLIAFNPVEGLPFARPQDKAVGIFMGLLSARKIPFVLRKSKGGEISAACGQLGASRACGQVRV